jgi:hypothetical protein
VEIATRMPIAIRVLYMIAFAITFWILTWVLAVTVIAQLILTLLAGQPNPELLKMRKDFQDIFRKWSNLLHF